MNDDNWPKFDYYFFPERFLSQFLFFYLPVGIIILLNAILFVLIALNYQEARKRATATDQSNENGFDSQKTATKHIDKWDFRFISLLILK